MNKFCSQCGTNLEGKSICQGCGHVFYENPTPVAVGCVPIEDNGEIVGFLGIKRGIPPQVGKWAFPGGFADKGENARTAAAREIEEETGLKNLVASHIFHDAITPDGSKMLIFVAFEPISIDQIPRVSNEEVQEAGMLDASTVMAFPLHQEALDKLLAPIGPAKRMRGP